MRPASLGQEAAQPGLLLMEQPGPPDGISGAAHTPSPQCRTPSLALFIAPGVPGTVESILRMGGV